MKRIFTFLFAAMLAGQAWAQTTFTANGLKYTVNGNANNTVSVSIDEDYPLAAVNIPSTIRNGNETYTVTSIANNAFEGWGITSVVIPNTVTSIGNYAFDECMNLTSATIGSSVETIGDYAFTSCNKLTSLSFGSSLTTIGKDVFYGCSKLTEINIDNSNTTFATEDGVLFNKSKTTLILYPEGKTGDYTIPSSVTTIGINAFKECQNLTAVTIPSGVITIDNYAFYLCRNLAFANIPSTVTSIGDKAFYKCAKLKYIYISNNVTRIDYGAFLECSNLTIYCEVESKPDDWDDNWNPSNRPVIWEYKKYIYMVLSNTDYTVEISKFNGSGGDLTIPSTTIIDSVEYTVTSIGKNAFKDRSGLKSVIIPNTVTKIGDDAFNNCRNLKSVTIPNSVTSISSSMFEHCWELKSITIPNSVTSIGRNAFNDSGLKSITIPNTVTSIGYLAFYRCIRLTSIIVESGNENYVSENGVLFNKDKTTLICYPGGKEDEIYTIPNSVTSIYNYAFYDCCFSLTSVIVPNSVTTIGVSAFGACCKLESINIPNTVTSIGTYTFSGCSNLTSITIPNTVTSIGNNAFYGCTGLTSITIPHSVTEIRAYAFEKCTAIFNCEHKAQPVGWDADWCPDGATVIWAGMDANDPDNPELAVNTGDFTLQVTSEEEPYTAKISGYNGTNPYLVLPRKVTIGGKEYAVTTLGAGVFDCDSSINAVYIPQTISSVESMAFNKNYNLKIYCEIDCDEETVPEGWANNWRGSNNDNIVIGNTNIAGWYIYKITNSSSNKACILRYIGQENQLVVRDTTIISNKYYFIDSIGNEAFLRCNSIKELTIPKTIKKIDNYAFLYCDSITTLRYNTNAIGRNFANHMSLKTVLIGDAVTSIADWTFSNCSDLEVVTFGESVKAVGNNAFANCSKLKNVDFASIESLCKIKFDINESNPMELSHSLYINGEEVVDVYIPKTVSSISNRTFSGCSNLTSVSIPKSVTSIGEEAFQNCSNLTIFCEAKSQPEGWNEKWNPDNRPVVWGFYTDKKIRHVAITSNNNEYGSVEGSGYLIDSTETTITATPAQGYHFTSWSDNNIDNPRVIKATSDTLLTAMFEAHTIVVDSAVAATCTESGLTEGSHCSVCGDTLIAQKTVSAKGHTSVKDAAIAATCTEPGLAEGKHCSVCGTVIAKQDTIPAKGHTFVVDKEVEPTCTKTGLGEGSHCSVCNEVIVAQTTIAAIGHEFVNYIYNNDATTTADGTETAVCERGCGATDTRVKEGTKLATAVTESAANAVNIYAHGNTIVVENATEDIFVYNVMGALVCKEAIHRISTTITVNNSGVFIVKTGSTVKRVMVN